MIITKKFLQTVLLMSLGFGMNLSFLQATKPQPNYGSIELTTTTDLNDKNENTIEEEISCMTATLRLFGLTDKPIKITNADRLFAQRYINLIKEILDFSSISPGQKEELMEKFLEIIWALRSGEHCTFLDRPDVVIQLGQNALHDLIGRNDVKQEDVQFCNGIIGFLKESPHDRKIARVILPLCHKQYDQLSIEEEKLYIQALEHVLENSKFSDSSAKALLIEFLERCNNNSDNVHDLELDSLSIMDLKGELRRVCGHELSVAQKVLMALSGAEDPTFYEIGKQSGVLLFWTSVSFVVFVCGGLFVMLVTNNSKSFEKSMIIAACLAVGVFFAGMGRNCSHYWMTKKI